LINDATANQGGIQYAQRRKWDTKSRLLASIDKAQRLIGYEPRTDFEEGLRSTIDWFKTNWDRIDTSARFGPGISSAVREKTTDGRT
jgi:nucleoside-diphosphate-sugar epimerase